MKIRPAEPPDIPALVVLNAGVQALHAGAHPDWFTPADSDPYRRDVSAEFTRRLADPEFACFLAEVDGAARGYLLARRLERPANPYGPAVRLLYIDQIAVDPAFQGQGLGRALIEAVKGLAAVEAYETIALDVWAFNKEAQAFFSRMGFDIYNERRWLRLPQEADSGG